MKKKEEKPEELTEHQKIFCYEYIKDWNATNAALRAGYAETSAHSQACRMLKKDKVKKFIDDLIRSTIGNEIESTKLRVLRELKAIAFADITKDVNLVKYTREDGTEYMKVEFNETKDSDNKKAIQSIRATSSGGIEVKYHDKSKALEMLGRSVALFTDKVEHSGGVNISVEDARAIASSIIGKDDETTKTNAKAKKGS
jgi:phage terminase small subunit